MEHTWLTAYTPRQTINVWSHFLGLLSILYLALYHLPTRPSSPFSSLGSQVMIGLWLFLACKCMAASAIYHLLNGCSTKNVRKRATCLDFVGISGVIAASVLSAEVSFCSGGECRVEGAVDRRAAPLP